MCIVSFPVCVSVNLLIRLYVLPVYVCLFNTIGLCVNILLVFVQTINRIQAHIL